MSEKKATQPKFSVDDVQAIVDAQKAEQERIEANAEKLISVKFSDKELKDTTHSLKRGERKKFEKGRDIKISQFDLFSEDEKDDLIEFLADTRGIKNLDDKDEGELTLWVTLIVSRTNNPILFEGN